MNGGSYETADTAEEQGTVTLSWSTATASADASYSQTDGTYGTNDTVIKTVRFKVYTMTDDDGAGGASGAAANEMTSATGTLSNVVTLVTDPDGNGDITTTQQLARLIPAAPTFGEAEGFTYDAFGEVNGSWTAPGTKTDGLPNLPNSIGGYRIDVSGRRNVVAAGGGSHPEDQNRVHVC